MQESEAGMHAAASAHLLEEVGSLHVDAHGSKHDGKLLILLLLISLRTSPPQP